MVVCYKQLYRLMHLDSNSLIKTDTLRDAYTRNFECQKNKHARLSRITMGRSNKKEENLDGFWVLAFVDLIERVFPTKKNGNLS